MESNFVVTIIILILILLSLIGHLLLNVKPNGWNIYLLAAIISLLLALISATMLYLFKRQGIGQTKKELFRACFKKGLILGTIAFVAIILQIQYDYI